MSDIKLGKHTIQERDEFLRRKIAGYQKRHKAVSKNKARRYARVKWARKVNTEEGHIKKISKPRLNKLDKFMEIEEL